MVHLRRPGSDAEPAPPVVAQDVAVEGREHGDGLEAANPYAEPHVDLCHDEVDLE